MNDSAAQIQPDPFRPATPAPAVSVTPVSSAVAPRPRLWPGVLIVVLVWAAILLPPYLPGVQGTPLQGFVPLGGAALGTLLLMLWWLTLSRVHWTDRLLVLLFFVTSGLASAALADKSFVELFGPVARGVPLSATAFVAWLLISGGVNWPARRLVALVAVLLAWGCCDLLRLDGVWGDFQIQSNWRWTPTKEDAYLTELAKQQETAKPAAADDKPMELRPGDWPAFRGGAARDSRLAGVRLATDWGQNPPKKLWSHHIGPGWSSFAVVGDHIYTQEQRGDKEAIVCYDAATGEERWAHTDAARFDEALGGPGPRATPTFADGWLYALGARGVLNCLDPVTGKVRWSRDIAADSGAKLPQWGFSASPLVAHGLVTVFAGGPKGKGVMAYHASSGEIAWSGGDGTDGYCSTQLTNVGGTEQLLVAANNGLTALDPTGGKVLWSYKWDISRPPRVAQPALVGDSDVLLGTPFQGLRRLHVTHAGDSWGEEQVWESKDIKPYYNDLVIYKDHLYGFDSSFFTCVSLEDGKGKWRARGYGTGQVILLPDQGLLLISTEKGEVVLVEATPEKHKEVAKFKAIEGKTWNHPVLAHGKLYIRNGEEVACFQLPEESGKTSSGK
jgi:outer membrane protein assembly factor BamB